jgi:hypothetical protein
LNLLPGKATTRYSIGPTLIGLPPGGKGEGAAESATAKLVRAPDVATVTVSATSGA